MRTDLPNRRRAEYATRLFLAEMRRQFMAAHPGRDVPTLDLDAYPAAQRSMLMAAIQKAAVGMTATADAAFLRWLEAQGVAHGDEGK